MTEGKKMPKTKSKEFDMLRNLLAIVAFVSAIILAAVEYGYLDLSSVIVGSNLAYLTMIGGMAWAIPELLVYRKNDNIYNLMAAASAITAAIIGYETWQGNPLHVYLLWAFVGATGITFVAEWWD